MLEMYRNRFGEDLDLGEDEAVVDAARRAGLSSCSVGPQRAVPG
jgi:2-hydroxychromene-2-carboxylate isomerase